MQCERGEKGTHSPALGGGGLRGAGLGVGGRASCGALPLAVPLRSRSPTLPAPWPTARRGSAAGRCRPGRRRPPRALGRPQRRPTRAAAVCGCGWGGGGERGGGGGKGGEDEKRDELIKSGAAEVFFFLVGARSRRGGGRGRKMGTLQPSRATAAPPPPNAAATPNEAAQVRGGQPRATRPPLARGEARAPKNTQKCGLREDGRVARKK